MVDVYLARLVFEYSLVHWDQVELACQAYPDKCEDVFRLEELVEESYRAGVEAEYAEALRRADGAERAASRWSSVEICRAAPEEPPPRRRMTEAQRLQLREALGTRNRCLELGPEGGVGIVLCQPSPPPPAGLSQSSGI